ncbi:DUF11 domain-containing protein [Phormidesmis priestleyi ULC007]|uniref:DUF11 domain-containing protein n=1 Tax=Phormidesmis priestleyi ULC007 TaxID=1920490 RepID=A0A2T1DIJ1_9CYAN|nr:DUF11 domain-containing protein [Phormidesmis priestleyi]PSB20329.1 DUF11 domain-containing protein [Phormidesmis priestleyi ULC007]PZO50198.1 MAG: DUF11 domain-containing protein [Phormidesmis priestleyi]
MKKQPYLVGLAVVTTLSMLPFNGAPLLAKAIDAGNHLAANVLKQPKVELNLSAEKQHLQKDEQGKEITTWQAMTSGNTGANPGDVIRYTLKGENKGDRAAKNLAVTQPIPIGTVYVLNSATVVNTNNNAITYSIDSGKTFVTKPVIKVTLASGQIEQRPAPAEAYTHIRLSVNNGLEPKADVKAAYWVKVRS